jgi:valyl-tRNA synthetase
VADVATTSGPGDVAILDAVATSLGAVRKAKSDAQASMRAEVASAVVTGPAADLDRIRQAEGDLRAAGRIAALEFVAADGPITVDVTLAPVAD